MGEPHGSRGRGGIPERQLPGNTRITAAYVFSRGLRLPIFIDSNIAPTTQTRTYDATETLPAPRRTPSPCRNNAVPGRIDPTGPVLTGYSDVNSWYNSMVLSFLRSAWIKAWSLLVNYTLSKPFDGGQVPGQFGTFNGTDSSSTPITGNWSTPARIWTRGIWIVGNVVWVPQFTRKITSKLARLIVDGFTFAGIADGGQRAGRHQTTPSAVLMPRVEPPHPQGRANWAVVNIRGRRSRAHGSQYDRSNSFTGLWHRQPLTSIIPTPVLHQAKRSGWHSWVKLSTCSTSPTSFASTQRSSHSRGRRLRRMRGHTNGCVVANPAFLAPTASEQWVVRRPAVADFRAIDLLTLVWRQKDVAQASSLQGRDSSRPFFFACLTLGQLPWTRSLPLSKLRREANRPTRARSAANQGYAWGSGGPGSAPTIGVFVFLAQALVYLAAHPGRAIPRWPSLNKLSAKGAQA